ncbi:hypothetical protein GCM10025883_24260 [Mobilicoccus caccae]|uniref:Uncharacterized protein n=1 Tax=Mobilicoccus caccae TaxID=1859295 RepID=A0ABQ6ITK4_9MICO|nr:hypothetical protein GCM10025883_24260 [Mobilicoccus caccae]
MVGGRGIDDAEAGILVLAQRDSFTQNEIGDVGCSQTVGGVGRATLATTVVPGQQEEEFFGDQHVFTV